MNYDLIEVISDEAVLKWAALRESLEEELLADAAASISLNSPLLANRESNTTGNNSRSTEVDRVKLFREPQVQEFVAWIQESDDEEEDDDEDDSDEED